MDVFGVGVVGLVVGVLSLLVNGVICSIKGGLIERIFRQNNFVGKNIKKNFNQPKNNSDHPAPPDDKNSHSNDSTHAPSHSPPAPAPHDPDESTISSDPNSDHYYYFRLYFDYYRWII